MVKTLYLPDGGDPGDNGVQLRAKDVAISPPLANRYG